MGNSNAVKAKCLGMPYGTASARLRKILLFTLLQKYGENVCFKCEASIETVQELSIEHKRPWEGISADLFWDLSNVAFSHLSCNRPHRNAGGIPPIKKKVGPDGTSWCTGCKTFHPTTNFTFDKSGRDGLQTECRAYRSKQRSKV